MTESFEPVARRRRALSLRAVVVGVVMVVASAGLGYMAVTGRGLVVTREPVVVQVIAGVIALAPLAAAGRVVTTVRRVRVARRVQIGGAGIRLVEGARMPVDVPWAELADVVVVRSYTTAGQCDERLHLVLRPDSPLARTLPAWRAGTGRHRAFPVPGFPVAKLRAAIDRVPSAGRLAGVGRHRRARSRCGRRGGTPSGSRCRACPRRHSSC